MAYTKKEDALNYINQYQRKKYDRITLMASKGKKEKYQAAAKLKGMSLSAFIMSCVDDKIEEMKK